MSSRKTAKRRRGFLRRAQKSAAAELMRLQATVRCSRDERRIAYLARRAGVSLEQVA